VDRDTTKCNTDICRDLSLEYVSNLRDTTIHLAGNKLICDASKAGLMEKAAHLLAVYAAWLRQETVVDGELERLHEYTVTLLPPDVVKAYNEWKDREISN